MIAERPPDTWPDFCKAPIDWRERLILLSRQFAKTPDVIARHPWSMLLKWCDWIDLTDR